MESPLVKNEPRPIVTGSLKAYLKKKKQSREQELSFKTDSGMETFTSTSLHSQSFPKPSLS